MLVRSGSLLASLFLQFSLVRHLFFDFLWGILADRRLQGQRPRRRPLQHFSFLPFGYWQLFLTLAATLASSFSLACLSFCFCSSCNIFFLFLFLGFQNLVGSLKLARMARVDGLLVCTFLQQLVFLLIIGPHFHNATEETSE